MKWFGKYDDDRKSINQSIPTELVVALQNMASASETVRMHLNAIVYKYDAVFDRDDPVCLADGFVARYFYSRSEKNNSPEIIQIKKILKKVKPEVLIYWLANGGAQYILEST